MQADQSGSSMKIESGKGQERREGTTSTLNNHVKSTLNKTDVA